MSYTPAEVSLGALMTAELKVQPRTWPVFPLSPLQSHEGLAPFCREGFFPPRVPNTA